jgi:hypothetical protein
MIGALALPAGAWALHERPADQAVVSPAEAPDEPSAANEAPIGEPCPEGPADDHDGVAFAPRVALLHDLPPGLTPLDPDADPEATAPVFASGRFTSPAGPAAAIRTTTDVYVDEALEDYLAVEVTQGSRATLCSMLSPLASAGRVEIIDARPVVIVEDEGVPLLTAAWLEDDNLAVEMSARGVPYEQLRAVVATTRRAR